MQSGIPIQNSKLRVPTEIPNYHSSFYVTIKPCAVLERLFSDGGEDGLEARNEGATSSGQWEAIYCYGHEAAPVAIAVNS
jgi:hypothetical protein